jgi:hypothetical protein
MKMIHKKEKEKLLTCRDTVPFTGFIDYLEAKIMKEQFR